MARRKPPAPTLVSADDIELELYEAMRRGDVDRLMGAVVRRRRDLLHPSRRRAPGRRGGDPRLVRGDVRQRHDRRRAASRAPARIAFERGAQRARAGSRHDGRRRAVRLGRRDQRLPEVVAGLAPRRAPRQPGHGGRGAGRSPRRRRRCTDRAPSSRDERLPRAALAARRPCADHLAGASSAAASTARGRPSGASAGRRPTATSSTSTGRATTPRRRCSFSSTASRARRRATTRRPSPPRRARRGWRFAVPHFRGCSGEINLGAARLPLGRLTRRSAGCSARFRGAARRRRSSPSASRSAATRCCASPRKPARAPRERVRAVAAVSAPLDLAAGGRAIGRGFGRQVYTRMFMRTMKTEGARQARASIPACSTPRRCARRATCATSTRSSPRPLHGFAGADDYYARGSAKAAARAHPHPGAGAQRAQRSVPAGVGAAARRARSAPA